MAGSIATAYVQVMPSMKGVKSNLEQQFGAEGSRSGSFFGSNLIKTAIGAISVAKIGEALGKTLTEGADLQQSLGGIETMFRENADAVVASAFQAYETAGLSANSYMEQVTSFSASLLQSLSGDTAQAASVADMALTDMSDNANKFGSDMEAITNAYQGFAKQNYTMLDNLKLGYGGTKTEMQRLLKDAQALTGVKYDIDNLSDVYNAIHAIQEELGITGTTAQEAGSTLTGSFDAMKAAFSNVLGNLSLGRELQPSLNTLAGTTGTFLKGNLVPAVLNIVKALPGTVGTLLKAAMPGSMKSVVQSAISGFTGFLTDDLPEMLSSGTEMVDQLCAGFSQGGPSLAAAGSEVMGQLLTCVIASLPVLLDGGGQMLISMAAGFLAGAPGLLSAAGSLLEQLVVSLITEGLPQLLSGGSSLILSMAQGMISGAPGVISSAVSIGGELLATIASCLPEFLAQGISMIGSLVAGLISMVPDVISAGADIAGDLLDTILAVDWLGLGGDIVAGIVSGIWKAASSLLKAMADLAGQALQKAKDVLDINSPSHVFENEVGKSIPEGTAVGVRKNMGYVRSALGELYETAASGVTAALKYRPSGGSAVSGPTGGGRPVQIIQNIYSKAQTAADLMQEARYQAEMAVLLGA